MFQAARLEFGSLWCVKREHRAMISLDFISVSVGKRGFIAHEMNVFVYFTGFASAGCTRQMVKWENYALFAPRAGRL